MSLNYEGKARLFRMVVVYVPEGNFNKFPNWWRHQAYQTNMTKIMERYHKGTIYYFEWST